MRAAAAGRGAALAAALLVGACTSVPEGIEPVEPFALDRYLGTWYEIARLDHRFERGLARVSATYSLDEDGTVRVVNRGHDVEEGEWRESVGRARFVDGADEGHLEVSFFGPFYGSYVVFGLDDGYTRSFVTGPDRDYLWFLSRDPEVPEAEYEGFVDRARALGFDVEELIRVRQDGPGTAPGPTEDG